MDLMSILWSSLSGIWVVLSSAYSVVYFVQCNLIPIIVNILVFLLPLWLLARKKLTKSKISMAFLNPENIISEIYKMVPATAHNGWELMNVQKGLRMWQQLTEKFSRDVAVISGTLCLDCKPKSALNTALDMEELPHWFDTGHFTVTQLIPERKLSSRSMETSFNSDTISYHRNRPTKTAWGVVHDVLNYLDLERLVTTYIKLPPKQEQQEIIIRRVWHVKENGQCFMLILPEKPELAGYHWTCYLFSEVDKSRMISLSLATVISLPVNNNQYNSEGTRLSCQLCSLRENVVFKKLGVYGRRRPRKPPASHTQKPANVVEPISLPVNKSDLPPLLNDEVLPTTLPDLPKPADKDDAVEPVASYKPPAPTSASSRYDGLIQRSVEMMLEISRGTEKDGWTHMGVTKDVEVMKKTPSKGQHPPSHTVKGKGLIRAPPDYVLQFLLNDDISSKVDEMLKDAQPIEKISDFVFVARLMYKAVWPTTARDFVILSYCTRINATTRVRGAFSVTHPDAPEDPSYVRGECFVGGYIIKDCPNNPATCEVTYMSQSDLKGSIPTMVVNKAMASQPMCVSRLRNMVEPLYSNPQKDPVTVEALNNTQVPPPFEVPVVDKKVKEETFEVTEENKEIKEENKEIKEESPRTVTIIPTAVINKVSDNHINESVKSTVETGGWELVHEEPPVDIFMDELQPVPESDRLLKDRQPNGILQHNTTTLDAKSSPSSVTPPPGSAPVRTYTPLTNSSEEEGTASEPDSEENLEDSTIGLLRPKKKHAFNAPDLFKNTWKAPKRADNSDALSVLSAHKLTSDVISYPMRENRVDFRTMGNQAAAELLQEVFYTSAVDVRDPSTYKILDGGWKYQFYEKGIVVLNKKNTQSPFFSLMGKGIIEMAPDKVFEALRNPRLRYTYDNLLKSMDFVKKIDDDLYILYLMLETTQCFLKKARDLCILIAERSEVNRDMVVGVSVSVPECPQKPNLNRAQVSSSGWVVEPIEVNHKTYSSVTYLIQVDFGGIPARLVHYISKRQPLAIAYLREYLLGV